MNCLQLQDKRVNSVDRLVVIFVLGVGTGSETLNELVGLGRAVKQYVGLKQQGA
jgi:hypothetical protein